MRLWARSILVLMLAAPAGLAQTDADVVRARKLYSQGVTQEAAGDWAGALATFEDVARLKLTPQVRFHIARCKEHLGRLNEALGGYRMAEYEASGGGAKEHELELEAKKAREDLEARIPKLKIVRGKDADSIKIELDGVALGDAQVGQEIAVDPGPHVITGIVASGKRFKKEVRVSERGSTELTLDVPADLAPNEPVSTEPHPAPTSSTSGGTEPMPPEPERPVAHGGSAAPWIVGGLGVASLVAGAIFYKLRADAAHDLDNQCLGRTCPDTLRSTQSRGETYNALSGVGFALGVAGIGAATLMFLGQSSSSPAEPSAASSFRIDHRGLGVRVGGRF